MKRMVFDSMRHETYRVFFLTGPPLKGGPVQNHVKVLRLGLPWSSSKSLSTWTGPPLKSQNYLSARLALPLISLLLMHSDIRGRASPALREFCDFRGGPVHEL